MNTVIYDGECNFCIDKVEWFKQQDPHHELEFVPRQNPEVEQRFPAVKDVNLNEGIIYIDGSGKLHVAADGIYMIAKHLNGVMMRLFAALYPLPVFKQAAQFCYRIIAANRKRLGRGCASGACDLPPVAKR